MASGAEESAEEYYGAFEIQQATVCESARPESDKPPQAVPREDQCAQIALGSAVIKACRAGLG